MNNMVETNFMIFPTPDLNYFSIYWLKMIGKIWMGNIDV